MSRIINVIITMPISLFLIIGFGGLACFLISTVIKCDLYNRLNAAGYFFVLAGTTASISLCLLGFYVQYLAWEYCRGQQSIPKKKN